MAKNLFDAKAEGRVYDDQGLLFTQGVLNLKDLFEQESNQFEDIIEEHQGLQAKYLELIH